MTAPSPIGRRRRLALVFAIGAAWVGLVAWFAHAVLGDDDWSWAEAAVRSAMGGFTTLAIAAVVPPKHLRTIQRAVAGSIYRGRLPHGIDPELWRAALLHHRGALWVWRWLFPALFGGAALFCAGATFFVTGGPLAALAGIALALGGAALGCRIYARRREATLDDLLAELRRRDAPAG